MCTFLFWLEHCGIWNRCILGFVKVIYWVEWTGKESEKNRSEQRCVVSQFRVGSPVEALLRAIPLTTHLWSEYIPLSRPKHAVCIHQSWPLKYTRWWRSVRRVWFKPSKNYKNCKCGGRVRWMRIKWPKSGYTAILLNSLRPSDAYMRQYTNRHWFR